MRPCPPALAIALWLQAGPIGLARSASPLHTDEPPPPLPAAATAAFAALRPDPPPAGIIRNTHYIISNEDRPQAFRAPLEGRGGVYVGVGSEQNYLMAGWARPEVLVLMDFDQVIVDLHRVYGVLLQAAPGPTEFFDLWAQRSEERIRPLLLAAYPNAAAARGVLRAYSIARFAVPARLEKLQRVLSAAGVPSFLSDKAQYSYLASLWRAGRVFPVRGDLTADRTLNDVSAAARAAELPVRVLYLSNAERYFPYGANFKRSISSLPFDERSVVLRTGARRIGAYVYIVQEGPGFQAWLRRPGILSVHQLARLREPDPEDPEGGAALIRRQP